MCKLLQKEGLKLQHLRHWIFHALPDHQESLVSSQRQQVITRLSLILLGGLYMTFYGQLFAQYKTLCWSAIGLYVLWQFYTFLRIPKQPISTTRLLISPALDVALIGMGIILDGGQNSGIFFCYFVLMMSNGMRFGNPMLIYAQALAFSSYLFTCIFTYINPQLQLNIPLLSWQLLALLLLPYYIYHLNKPANRSFHRQKMPAGISFGLLEHSPMAIFTFQETDHQSPRISYANAAMQSLYRNDINSLIGEQVDIIALMEDGHEVIKACQQSFRHPQQVHRFYIRGRNPNDQIIQLMGQVSRLHRQRKTTGICFLIDITHNEDMHSDMQKNMHEGYISTLVAGIVHDFRNVLTTIIGSAEIIQFSAQDASIIKQLGLIIDAAERGSNITSNLLSLSKNNKQSSITHSQAIDTSLNSMIELLRIQLPAHIKLQLDIDKPLPSVAMSLTQLEQILMNLIKNSAESMQNPGCIHIQLRADNKHPLAQKNTPALHICVCDEGQGIAPEDIAMVSKAFWSSRKKEGGTGLGMTMVQQITLNHGGSFDIQSSLGKGTQVDIVFPAIHAQQGIHHNTNPAENNTLQPQKQPQSHYKLIPWHILLVDDCPNVLLVHKDLLKQMGHRVSTATDGQEAWQLYQHSLTQDKHEQFDAIISDFRMPSMDGIDLSMLIRKKDSTIPILILTAYGNKQKLQQSASIQVGILAKPTSYKKLKARIMDIQQRSLPSID